MTDVLNECRSPQPGADWLRRETQRALQHEHGALKSCSLGSRCRALESPRSTQAAHAPLPAAGPGPPPPRTGQERAPRIRAGVGTAPFVPGDSWKFAAGHARGGGGTPDVAGVSERSQHGQRAQRWGPARGRRGRAAGAGRRAAGCGFGQRVRLRELPVRHRLVPERALLHQATAVRGHPGGPAAVPQRGLQEDGAAQSAGARDHGRGEAASQQLGAPAQQELPHRHAGLPLLTLRTRLPGPAHLPLPLALRGRARLVRASHAVLRFLLARDAQV